MRPRNDILLQAVDVSKHYGGIAALDGVSLSVPTGSVYGLLGKNGAGKSTLVGIVAGLTRPDRGEILFRNSPVTRDTYTDRRRRGIELLRQHAEVLPSVSVAENLVAPAYPLRRGVIDRKQMRITAKETLAKYGLSLPPGMNAGDLNIADQRKLNIVKALSSNAALIMLDEPTTALTLRERKDLLTWIRVLADDGATFVYISHANAEVREVCDGLTVLRDGRVVSSGEDPRCLSPVELSGLVTGGTAREFQRSRQTGKDVILKLQDLRSRQVGPVSLEIRAGEVVGFAGFPGSGARELARALGGLRAVTGGHVLVNDALVRTGSVKRSTAAGISYLTHDRLGEGLVPEGSVAENLVLGAWPSRRGAVLDRRAIRTSFMAYEERLSLRARGPAQMMKELSGGNQQKILLGRLLRAAPRVLILDEPTLGVDVGAKEEIHEMVDELTKTGTAVVVLAYDTDEMVRLVDRVMVFRDGRLTEVLSGEQIDPGVIESSLSGEVREPGLEPGRSPG